MLFNVLYKLILSVNHLYLNFFRCPLQCCMAVIIHNKCPGPVRWMYCAAFAQHNFLTDAFWGNPSHMWRSNAGQVSLILVSLELGLPRKIAEFPFLFSRYFQINKSVYLFFSCYIGLVWRVGASPVDIVHICMDVLGDPHLGFLLYLEKCTTKI